MATPTSYLQTLSQDEAIAFIRSLQKVKSHLSGELEWMTQQVEQKTTQLQGIETLLAEAIALGFISPGSDATADVTTAKTIASPPPSQTVSPAVGDGLSNGSHAAKSDLDTAPLNRTTSTTTSPKSVPPMSAMTKKANEAKAKKPSSSLKSAGRESQSKAYKELRELLVPKFRNKTFTDVVAHVLSSAAKPLHLDELLSEMYGTLSTQDFKRAKVSLANVLSVGKNEGKWKNLGQGMYAANSVASS